MDAQYLRVHCRYRGDDIANLQVLALMEGQEIEENFREFLYCLHHLCIYATCFFMSCESVFLEPYLLDLCLASRLASRRAFVLIERLYRDYLVVWITYYVMDSVWIFFFSCNTMYINLICMGREKEASEKM